MPQIDKHTIVQSGHHYGRIEGEPDAAGRVPVLWFYPMAQPVLRRVKPVLFTRFPEAGSQLPEDKAAFAALLHIG